MPMAQPEQTWENGQGKEAEMKENQCPSVTGRAKERAVGDVKETPLGWGLGVGLGWLLLS